MRVSGYFAPLAIALAAACWPPLADLEGGKQGAGDAAIADAAITEARVAYRDVVLADGPLLYWRFGEKIGSRVINDESGHGYTGTYYQDATLGAHGALAFDSDTAMATSGTSGITTLGDSSDPDPRGVAPYTIEVWFAPAASPPVGQIVTKQINDANGDEETGISLDPMGRIIFDRYVSNAPVVAAAPPPPTGRYTYVAGVYDGAKMILYVDGAFADQKPDTRPLAPKAGKWTVGMSWADHDIFNGSIDELAYYGKALTPDRITLHHDVGVGR
jgi:hypothetical protein